MRVSVRVIADVVIFVLYGRMTVSPDGDPFVRGGPMACARSSVPSDRSGPGVYMDSTCVGEIVAAY